MKDDKKIIGVCLSMIQDDFKKEYITYLYMHAAQTGYKLIIFNSLLDLYNHDAYDKGSAAVFNVMNFEVLDAVVVLCESLHDNAVIESIREKAAAAGVPVVLIHGTAPGCYCVVTEFEQAYKHIIRHVIKDHSATDIFFIAGRRENDPISEERLRCCREVMAESGLKLDDSCIGYGEYWDVPPKNIVRDLLSTRGTLPRAIICANDSMAVAVCEEVALHGLKVPEDVIVTGFDGLLSAEYFVPRLTTCKEDMPSLAAMTLDIIGGAIAGTKQPGIYKEQFFPYISESCGCGDDSGINYRERERYLYRVIQDINGHEFHIYNWVDRVLESDNINSLTSALRDYVLPNSSVCLRNDFITSAMGHGTEKLSGNFSDELLVISSRNVDYSSGRQGRFSVKDMIPDIGDWLKDKTMCILTPIFVEDEVCGYYVVKTENVSSAGHKINRLTKIMNVAFSSLMNRMMKKKLQLGMQNAVYTDALTALPNLKGLVKWFDDYSAVKENHQKTLTFSVYAIPQYKFIYETYGIQDIEETVKFVAEALTLANGEGCFVARTGDDEFIVVNCCDSPDEVGGIIDSAVSVFFGVIEGYNTNGGKDYFVEVNCGCTVVNPGWTNTLRTFIKLANAEMYMNRLKAGMNGPVKKDEKKAPEGGAENSPKDRYRQFNLLLEKNLLTYFFQPIVDAKTGEICAYEALMRSTGGIKMNPLEILDTAKEYGRLYDIEKATMFNIMERYVRDRKLFGNARVFINTIPGCFLRDSDLERFAQLYGDYIENIVIEITEQDTVSDEELDSMKMLGIGGLRGRGAQIAVDDYGTGHSNIVNLLRYSPQIIKIDRFLISNIQNDSNKQMFVKSTIEFARMNDIKILAEGVETHDELVTVIDYGVDYIQGYYTARPAPDPVKGIPAAIRHEIVDENLNLSRYDNESLIYHAADGETVDLYETALRKFVGIQIGNGNVRLKGSPDNAVSLTVETEENSVCFITLENINLKSGGVPIINIGSNSTAQLILEGSNKLSKDGIFVPEGASLRITGDGSLNISSSHSCAVGIGSRFDERYGNIVLDLEGTVHIEVGGDRSVGIGGGTTESSSLSVESGRCEIVASGINVVGIGGFAGKTKISVAEKGNINIRSSGMEAVGIGVIDGVLDFVSCGELDVTADGETSAATGFINGSGSIVYETGNVLAVVHGDDAACIGSVNGRVEIKAFSAHVKAYGEGNRVCGIGSLDGTALTNISGGTAAVELLSGDPRQFGNGECRTVISGGNILAAKEADVNAVNIFGERLAPLHVESDTYEYTFASGGSEYTYKAERSDEDDRLCVFVPKNG